MPDVYSAPILKPVAAAVRPWTGSTQRLSMASLASTRRPRKYGTGKHAQTELVPQPSDDAEDPLNWSTSKKEAGYWTLLLLVALASVSKTALLPVGGSDGGVSYSSTAMAALTGVPLMVSAVSGLASLAAARLCGKRAVYLASAVLLLVGTVWGAVSFSSHHQNYSQSMAARVLQGLGWGAFDVLVRGSISDVFFAHERGVRDAMYDVVVVACTWGGPLLGGVVVVGGHGHVSRPFVVLGSLLGLALLLLVLAVPETVYDDREFSSHSHKTSVSTTTTAATYQHDDLPLRARSSSWSAAGVRAYLASRSLRPVANRANVSRTNTVVSLLWQAPRSMAAPTTVLLAMASLLPLSALWGIAASLGSYFAPHRWSQAPASVGVLFVGPFVLATAVVVGVALLRRPFSSSSSPFPSSFPSSSSQKSTSPLGCTAALVAGSLLSLVGLLVLGFYLANTSTASHLDFPAVSFFLGLLAAGAYLVDAATLRPMVARSTQFTSASTAVAQRNTDDMCSAVGVWRTLAVGALVTAWPHVAATAAQLKTPCIGFGVAQVAVAGVVGLVWWRLDEAVHRVDGQVMRCVDLGMLKRTGSFFDAED